VNKLTLLAVLGAYLVFGWSLYARWATRDHPDCNRSLTPECYARVFAGGR
jgi:hypothetical protein